VGRVQGAELVCPGCGASAGPDERFCAGCGLPLVLEAGAQAGPPESAEVSERRRRLRKVAPQLAEGPLMKVAWVRNQAEGEFIQGLLLEEGVPSLLRRSPGFDVPDMLFAGPRDVMVAASGVDVAREALLDARLIEPAAEGRRAVVRPWPLLAGLLCLLVAGIAVIWALSLVVH
jgi:sirohydrochlorin ferrochelatase